MTDREKAIIEAFTGVCMLTGEKTNEFYKYLTVLFGRPVYTHEIGFLSDEIKARAKNDFIELCRKDEERKMTEKDVYEKVASTAEERDNIQTPKTVYIVTSGEYSDYQIDAVFDDKNKAKDFIALQLAKRKCPDVYQPAGYYDIETYEIQDAVKIPDSMKLIYYYYSYKPSTHFAVLDKNHIDGPIVMLKRDYNPNADRIECVLDDDDFEKAVKILSEKFYIEKAKIEGVSI